MKGPTEGWIDGRTDGRVDAGQRMSTQEQHHHQPDSPGPSLVTFPDAILKVEYKGIGGEMEILAVWPNPLELSRRAEEV